MTHPSIHGTYLGETTLVGRLISVRPFPNQHAEIHVSYLGSDASEHTVRLTSEKQWDDTLHPGDLIVARGLPVSTNNGLLLDVPADQIIAFHTHEIEISEELLAKLDKHLNA